MMTVAADQLRGGDLLHWQTLQGRDVLIPVHGILIQDWSVKRTNVTVFTKDADYEYRADELLQIERPG